MSGVRPRDVPGHRGAARDQAPTSAIFSRDHPNAVELESDGIPSVQHIRALRVQGVRLAQHWAAKLDRADGVDAVALPPRAAAKRQRAALATHAGNRGFVPFRQWALRHGNEVQRARAAATRTAPSELELFETQLTAEDGEDTVGDETYSPDIEREMALRRVQADQRSCSR